MLESFKLERWIIGWKDSFKVENNRSLKWSVPRKWTFIKVKEGSIFSESGRSFELKWTVLDQSGQFRMGKEDGQKVWKWMVQKYESVWHKRIRLGDQTTIIITLY